MAMTDPASITPLSPERVETLLEAYGGDPARWPIAERNAALAAIANSPALQSQQKAAQDLDAALGSPLPIEPSLDLRTKVLAWRPKPLRLTQVAAAMAASAVLGVTLGLGAADLAPTRQSVVAAVAQPELEEPAAEALVLAALVGETDPFLEEGFP
jgi:hypothetical protein